MIDNAIWDCEKKHVYCLLFVTFFHTYLYRFFFLRVNGDWWLLMLVFDSMIACICKSLVSRTSFLVRFVIKDSFRERERKKKRKESKKYIKSLILAYDFTLYLYIYQIYKYNVFLMRILKDSWENKLLNLKDWSFPRYEFKN